MTALFRTLLLACFSLNAYAQFVPEIPATSIAGSGNRLYLIVSGGGVMRTENAGAAWLPVEVVPGVSPGFTFVAADPTNVQHVFVATTRMENGGIYRSTDSGVNWMASNNGLPSEGEVKGFFVIRNRSDLVYLRIDREIYKTEDGGMNWTLRSTLPGPTFREGRAFHINPVDPSVWYYALGSAAFSTTSTVYRSIDEGATWQARDSIRIAGMPDTVPNGIGAIASSPEDPDVVWAAQAGGWLAYRGMYMSTDGGDTFERVNQNQPLYVFVDLLGNVFYVTSTGSTLSDYYRSTNGGTTFTRIEFDRDQSVALRFFQDYSQTSTLYTVTPRGPYRSTDSGRTWTPLVGEVQGTLNIAPIEIKVPSTLDMLDYNVGLSFRQNRDWEADFTASVSGGDWVELDATSGRIPTRLGLHVSTQGLSEGTYTATLTIQCDFECMGSPVEIPIHLSIVEPGDLTAPEFLISTVAGSRTETDRLDAVPATETLLRPYGIDLDADGGLLITEFLDHYIRRVGPDGQVETIAGTGVEDSAPDGVPAKGNPVDTTNKIAADRNGGFWFDDGAQLRHVDENGILSSIPGYFLLDAITVDDRGHLFVADDRITEIGPNGNTLQWPEFPEDLPTVNGLVAAPDGSLYLSTASDYVYRFTFSGELTVIAGNGIEGYSGDNLPAPLAALDTPRGLAMDEAGNLFIADSGNDRVRMVDSSGFIFTVAGGGDGPGDSGPALDAELGFPVDLVFNDAGELYVSDRSNGLIRLLSPVRPTIGQENGITNAASFEVSFSPGSLLSVFGNFDGALQGSAPEFPWPTMLNGVRVTLNGRDMPLSFTSEGQINAQIPYETELGTAVLVVYVNGIASAPRQIQIDAASPGILAFGANRAVAVNLAGTDNPYEINTDSTPVDPGGYVVVYLIGMGVPSSTVTTGEVAPDEPLITPATQPVTVMIGDRTVPFDFLGLTPGWVGLVQLNLPIPADLADGDYPIKVTIGEKPSNTPVITVRQ